MGLHDFYGCEIKYLSNWIKKYKYAEIDHASLSYAVYEILKDKNYDVVHFNDWRGSGFYYAMARRQGLIDTIVVTHTHGPTKWVSTYNHEIADIDAAEISALEFSQIENSDYVVSPSKYLLDWYADKGVVTKNSRVINWILPSWINDDSFSITSPLTTRAIEKDTIEEIVFFGRQERRKGFDLFLSAIKARPELSNLNLTFLGRFDRFEREFTGSRVFRILPDHKGAIRFFNQLDQREALSFLRQRPRALAVMPSLIENSPCTVGECFTIGIPFVTTAVGGIPELFEGGAHSRALVKQDYNDLADRLVQIVQGGMDCIVSTLEPTRIRQQWLDFHETTFREVQLPQPALNPLVSVCLVHYNRSVLLRRALSALSEQTYKNFEVVLVDDGSKDEHLRQLDKIEEENWPFNLRIVRTKNKYLGAARNTAVSYASGDFVIFHDDDNISEPSSLETFVRAAISGNYDILTSQYYVFSDESGPEECDIRYFPFGIGGSFSYFRNRFGDANALIRKAVFNDIGGFSELKGVGWEDWEFFLRAYLAGSKMGVIPEPLFRYRVSADGMLASTSPVTNNDRIISVVGVTPPSTTVDLLQFAKRESIHQQVLNHTWSVLGKANFSGLHQEMMALDPNSDEARHKLMELAFAMRRDTDAIELGLGLRNGFRQISMVLDAISSRSNIHPSAKAHPVKAVAMGRGAIAVRGWVGPKDSQSIRGLEIIHKESLYDVIHWNSQIRRDVNLHLNTQDELSRGFFLIGIREERDAIKVHLPFNLRRGIKSDRNAVVKLSSTHEVGKVEMRLSETSLNHIMTGCIDEFFHGQLFELIPPLAQADSRLSRITIKTRPNSNLYLLGLKENAVEEILTDHLGRGELLISHEISHRASLGALGKMQIFTRECDADLSVNFYLSI